MNHRLNEVTDWPGLAQITRYSSSRLARHCGVSARHLERFFQQHFQKSPHQRLRELRMERAAELMRNKLSVKEASIELGYKNTSHFCRDFKDFFALPPSRYAAQFISVLRSSVATAECRISAINVAFQQLIFLGATSLAW